VLLFLAIHIPESIFMKIKEIQQILEEIAPPALQESYDNIGLLLGDPEAELEGVLTTLDVTMEVIEEAIEKKCNLIICHHPVIFGGLKKLTGANYTERIVMSAIKNGIAIITSHTNFDSIPGGVNGRICDKIGLKNTRILVPSKGLLSKLVTFVPDDHAAAVREAIFQAGAGRIGNYDKCSYNLQGKGSFRGDEGTNPFVGKKGQIHYEEETRVETIFPSYLQGKIVKALVKAHPYEEVAYDIYPLDNVHQQIGMGMIGEFEKEEDEIAFLVRMKEVFESSMIKHTHFRNKPVKKIAVCGGSGYVFLKDAIRAGADVFLSSDFKYHQFFDAENKILVADIGHYESEQYTKDIFYEILTKKLSNFAVHLSKINTNPVKYL